MKLWLKDEKECKFWLDSYIRKRILKKVFDAYVLHLITGGDHRWREDQKPAYVDRVAHAIIASQNSLYQPLQADLRKVYPTAP